MSALHDQENFNKALTIYLSKKERYVTPEEAFKIMAHIPDCVRYFKKTPELVDKLVGFNGDLIEHCPDATFEQKCRALNNKPSALQYIRNQTPEICKYAVNLQSKTIQYARNAAPETYLLAVLLDPENLQYIEHQTDYMKNHAIEQRSSTIRYVINPTAEMLRKSINDDPDNIQYVPHVAQELWELAIGFEPSVIKYYLFSEEKRQEYDDLCHRVLDANAFLIENIKNPSLDIAIRAVSMNRDLIKQIQDPVIKKAVEEMLEQQRYATTKSARF